MSRLSSFLGGVRMAADAFNPWRSQGDTGSFEAAGQGRRLRNFQPSGVHVNAAIQRAGRTLIKRARFLVENNGYAGNAVDVWVAWLIGDGIVPRVSGSTPERRKALMKAWNRWIKEADADGITNLYGLYERAEREAYIAGESFIRFRARRASDMRSGIPMQLQVLPSEMLDPTYSEVLSNGNEIRMGIEFNGIGRRVAYHFWRYHPDDTTSNRATLPERTRVPAEDVLHIMPARQGGQIRGVPRMARAIVKLFSIDAYDDAELERKKTASLYTGFITKTGEGSPIDSAPLDLGDLLDEDDDAIEMQPGALIDLNDGEDVKFSAPAESGSSYEPFQYRSLLQVGAALGIPYAYLTGDATKGNFSNVRTEIMNFRRRVGQHQQNYSIPQMCAPVWHRWLDEAEFARSVEPDEAYRDEDHLPPRMEYIDPANDVKTDIAAVRAGFKNRGHVVSERGYDRDENDEDRAKENAEQDRLGLIYDTDPRRVAATGVPAVAAPGSGYMVPGNDAPDAQEIEEAKQDAASQQQQPAGNEEQANA